MNAAMFGSTQEVVSNKVRFGLVLGLYAVFGCHPQPRGLTAVAANPAFPQECPAKPGATLGQRELVGLPRAQNGLWKLLSAEGDDRLAVGAPFTAAWAQDGSTIIVLTREHITPFDAVTGHEGRSYALSEPASLKFQPVVSANGRYLAVHVECKPGRVEVIDRVRGANWHAETEHGPYTFSDDGTRLVADTHRIWSSESGQELYPDALWSRSRASSYWPDLPLPSGSQRPETEALLVQAAGGGYKELPAPFRVIFPDGRRAAEIVGFGWVQRGELLYASGYKLRVGRLGEPHPDFERNVADPTPRLLEASPGGKYLTVAGRDVSVWSMPEMTLVFRQTKTHFPVEHVAVQDATAKALICSHSSLLPPDHKVEMCTRLYGAGLPAPLSERYPGRCSVQRPLSVGNLALIDLSDGQPEWSTYISGHPKDLASTWMQTTQACGCVGLSPAAKRFSGCHYVGAWGPFEENMILEGRQSVTGNPLVFETRSGRRISAWIEPPAVLSPDLKKVIPLRGERLKVLEVVSGRELLTSNPVSVPWKVSPSGAQRFSSKTPLTLDTARGCWRLLPSRAHLLWADFPPGELRAAYYSVFSPSADEQGRELVDTARVHIRTWNLGNGQVKSSFSGDFGVPAGHGRRFDAHPYAGWNGRLLMQWGDHYDDEFDILKGTPYRPKSSSILLWSSRSGEFLGRFEPPTERFELSHLSFPSRLPIGVMLDYPDLLHALDNPPVWRHDEPRALSSDAEWLAAKGSPRLTCARELNPPASAQCEGTVQLWNVPGRRVRELVTPGRKPLRSLRFGSTKRFLAIGAGHFLHVWDLHENRYIEHIDLRSRRDFVQFAYFDEQDSLHIYTTRGARFVFQTSFAGGSP